MHILTIVATVLLQLFCVVHALRRGYPYHFVALILIFPLIGPMAYLIIEMGPDIYYRHIRPLTRRFKPKADPYQALAHLQMQVKNHPTIENQHQLAKIYCQIGQFNEALYLLENLLIQRAFAADPYLMLDKATAYFGLENFEKAKQVLENLKKENPQFQSPESHLLYARTLSELKMWQQADREFESLESHFHGLESSFYYLQHLRKINNQPRAHEVLNNMRNRFQRLPQHYRSAQKDWLKQAETDH